MSKPCPACADAENNPLTGFYNMACDACNARHLAQSPEFYASRVARDRLPAYERALADVFGAARVDQMHAAVKAWAQRIDAARVERVVHGYA